MTVTVPMLFMASICALFAVVYFQGMRIREQAISSARQYCRRFELQLLDETVQRERISLARDHHGNWRVWRRFGFEYTVDGSSRQPGHIVILGGRIVLIEVNGQVVIH